MFTRVQLTHTEGDWSSVDFFLGDEGDFVLKDARGLGPVKAQLPFTPFGNTDGGVISSRSVGARNTVLTIGYNQDRIRNEEGKRPEDLRHFLYTRILPKHFINVRIFDNDILHRIYSGYVESIEPNIFSRDPEFQISIISKTPYMMGDYMQYALDLEQGTHGFTMGGDVHYGYEVEVEILQDLDWFEIQADRKYSQMYNRTRDPKPTMRIKHHLPAGQTLMINTKTNEKDARIVDSLGTLIERVIGRVQLTDGWPDLLPGETNLRILSSVNGGTRTTVKYRDYFGGY